MFSAQCSGRPGVTAAVLATALLLGACTIIDTGSYADEKVDFGEFRTFSWIDDDPYIPSQSARDPSAMARSMIAAGIRRHLEGKGYAFTLDREAADMLVAYTVGAREEIRMDTYPMGYRGHWGWHEPYDHYYFRGTRVENYTRGTLGVDIFDNATGKPAWHGWAEKTVTREDRENPGPAIDEGIARLFASFPR